VTGCRFIRYQFVPVAGSSSWCSSRCRSISSQPFDGLPGLQTEDLDRGRCDVPAGGGGEVRKRRTVCATTAWPYPSGRARDLEGVVADEIRGEEARCLCYVAVVRHVVDETGGRCVGSLSLAWHLAFLVPCPGHDGSAITVPAQGRGAVDFTVRGYATGRTKRLGYARTARGPAEGSRLCRGRGG
jgi:hypothetical protein